MKLLLALLQILLTVWCYRQFSQESETLLAVDPITLSLIISGALSGLGSVLGSRSQNKAADAQRKRQGMTDQLTTNYMNLLGGPSSLENLGFAQMFSGSPVNQSQYTDWTNGMGAFSMPSLPNAYRDLGLATDPILQSMRGGPNDSAISSNLLGLLGTGNPYDTSLISSALDPIRQRGLSREVAALHAAAPGLGSRFGSATRRGEIDLRRQSLEDTNALDAQMLFAGHEAAQGRRLQAAGALTARDQLQLGRDSSALDALMRQAGIGIQQGQLGLGLGQLGLDRSRLDLDALLGGGQLGLAGQSQQNALLGTLLGAQTNRQQQYLQALGLMTGQPVASGPGYGPAVGDIGQLLLFASMLGGNRGAESRAFGGPLSLIRPTVVGELGPELIMPQDGRGGNPMVLPLGLPGFSGNQGPQGMDSLTMMLNGLRGGNSAAGLGNMQLPPSTVPPITLGSLGSLNPGGGIGAMPPMMGGGGGLTQLPNIPMPIERFTGGSIGQGLTGQMVPGGLHIPPNIPMPIERFADPRQLPSVPMPIERFHDWGPGFMPPGSRRLPPLGIFGGMF